MMGKTIESHDLNAKLCTHPRVVFFLDMRQDGHQRCGAHRHSRALSRVRAAHACSYHCLCHECKRLCPLALHEADGPSIRLAEMQNSVPAATALSARILADQVAGGMHPHMTRSSREENMIMRARRWWREVPPRPNTTHNPVEKTHRDGGFCETTHTTPMTTAG